MMTKNNPEALDDQNADLQSTTKEGKKIQVRVLLDCAHGKCNDVVELTSEQAKRAKEDGLVDTNPKAVAYATKELKEA